MLVRRAAASFWSASLVARLTSGAAGRLARHADRLRGARSSPRAPGTGRTFRGATSSRCSSRSALYAVRFAPTRADRAVRPRVAGALLALLAATRSFELIAVVARLGDRASASRVLRLGPRVAEAPPRGGRCGRVPRDDRRRLRRHREAGACSSCTRPFDHQSGPCSARRSPRPRRSSLALVPLKLVQLFLDPCYLSLCESPTTRRAAGIDRTSTSGASRSRSSCPRSCCSRSASSPSALLVVRASRRRDAARASPRELRLAGRDDGRRDRARPRLRGEHADAGRATCATGSRATSCSPSLLDGDRRRRARLGLLWRLARAATHGISPEVALRRRARASSPSASSLVTTARRALVRASAASRHDISAPSTYTARCAARRCDVRARRRRRPDGDVDLDPGLSTLTFGCGSDRAELHVLRGGPAAGVVVPSTVRRSAGSSPPGRRSWASRRAASSSPQSRVRNA